MRGSVSRTARARPAGPSHLAEFHDPLNPGLGLRVLMWPIVGPAIRTVIVSTQQIGALANAGIAQWGERLASPVHRTVTAVGPQSAPP